VFHKILANSGIGEQLLASLEDSKSMESVNYFSKMGLLALRTVPQPTAPRASFVDVGYLTILPVYSVG
jgi:hypothetical protein